VQKKSNIKETLATFLIIIALSLLTLFFFSLACNAFFTFTGNIGIPYAIHLGWNLIRFGSIWVTTQGKCLQEAEGFNLIEGNPLVVTFALGLAILAFSLKTIWKIAVNKWMNFIKLP